MNKSATAHPDDIDVTTETPTAPAVAVTKIFNLFFSLDPIIFKAYSSRFMLETYRNISLSSSNF